jgi:hypothetical protein
MKEPWMNSTAFCWYCNKEVDCECMDATCYICGRPFAKDRCHEFGFNKEGENTIKKCHCKELRSCLERLFIVAKDAWKIDGGFNLAQELDDAWKLLKETKNKYEVKL